MTCLCIHVLSEFLELCERVPQGGILAVKQNTEQSVGGARVGDDLAQENNMSTIKPIDENSTSAMI